MSREFTVPQSCQCYGCFLGGQGACGYRTCSECLETFPGAVPVAVEADEGQPEVRICAACVAAVAA